MFRKGSGATEIRRVLIVDDDVDTRANLCDILELDGMEVAMAGSLAEVMARTDWDEFSAVLLDRQLPDGTAEDVLPHLRRLAPRVAILIVTGHSDLQGAIDALRQGAFDYILKPINPDALRASLARVGERRRLAIAKEQSEAAFRTLVQTAPGMIVILRPNRRIAFFNEFAEQLTGYRAEEVKGKDYFSIFILDEERPLTLDAFSRLLKGMPMRGFETRVKCRDSTYRWVVWNAQLLRTYEGGPAVLGVGQDISQLKLAQEQALQSARLAAIGQMMTGLAHESGNALARSQACLEMLALEVQDRPEALDLITRIQKAQDHLRQLYEEVRGYAAPMRLEREVLDVSHIWRQAWTNLGVLRQGRDATLTEEHDNVIWTVPVDPFRLEQVFRNILENALAACRDPVRIAIHCADVEHNGRPALSIIVQDNGPGLTQEQRKKIFEPFFTTKTKGTGLGMAIAKRIIEAHGGVIGVGNEDKPGAQIVLTLPRDVT